MIGTHEAEGPFAHANALTTVQGEQLRRVDLSEVKHLTLNGATTGEPPVLDDVPETCVLPFLARLVGRRNMTAFH